MGILCGDDDKVKQKEVFTKAKQFVSNAVNLLTFADATISQVTLKMSNNSKKDEDKDITKVVRNISNGISVFSAIANTVYKTIEFIEEESENLRKNVCSKKEDQNNGESK